MEPSEEIAKLRASVAILNESVIQHYATMSVLETVLGSVVETHPNPSGLLVYLERNLEFVYAGFLGGSQSETALTHFQAASKRATDLCRVAIAAQAAKK
jgi:hypothetical protein